MDEIDKLEQQPAEQRAEIKRLTRERDAKALECHEAGERTQHFMRKFDAAEARVRELEAENAQLKIAVERGMHFHHRSECPKCHRYCTESTENDYGKGKFAVYDADCPCAIEKECDDLRNKLEQAHENAREVARRFRAFLSLFPVSPAQRQALHEVDAALLADHKEG